MHLQWQGAIHEYLPITHPYAQEDIEVHHHKKEKHTAINLAILEAVVDKDPTVARNVFYLAKEYFDADLEEKAMPLFKRVLEMPDAWCENKYEAFVRLGSHALSRKNYTEAQRYFYDAVKEVPLKAKAYYYLGNLALEQQHLEEALHWYRLCVSMKRPTQTIDLVEDHFHTWFPYLQMCLLYDKQGLYKEAAIANEKAMQFRPTDPNIQKNKAYFLTRLKDQYPLAHEVSSH